MGQEEDSKLWLEAKAAFDDCGLRNKRPYILYPKSEIQHRINEGALGKRIGAYAGLVLLTIWYVLGSLAEADAPVLIQLAWSDLKELEQIQSYDLDLRYGGSAFVLVSAWPADVDRLQREGWGVSILDRGDEVASPAGEYYAAWPRAGQRLSGLDGVRVILEDTGTTFLKVAPEVREQVWERCAFLVELPHRMSLEGMFPGAALSKRAAAEPRSAVVVALLDSVRVARIEQDIAYLVYVGPTRPYDNSPQNLRTRFARHPATRDSAATYIAAQLRKVLGSDAVALIPFRHTPDDSTMFNVVGTLQGRNPGAGTYILCGHYDSIAKFTPGWDWRTDPAPGADDNATGVACVLEAARVLSRVSFPWSIRFVAFSGEELGLWGSQAYAKEALERGDRILGVINIDMVGYNARFDRIQVISNPGSVWLLDRMQEVNATYAIGLRVDPLMDHTAIRTDHFPFWARGYDAVTGIEGYPPERDDPEGFYRMYAAMHTVGDVMDSLNLGLIRKVAQLCVATLAPFALENTYGEALPDLAIFDGDVRFAQGGDRLVVTVMDVGLGGVYVPFRVTVSRCEADSTDCGPVWTQEVEEAIPPGGSLDLRIPWQQLGDVTVLVQVDPDGRVREVDETNNQVYAVLRHVPASRFVVYPNPFFIGNGGGTLSFAGLSDGASVEISTPSGESVWSGEERRREVLWKGQNRVDFLVGSGIYFYRVVDVDGYVERIGTLAVIRKE